MKKVGRPKTTNIKKKTAKIFVNMTEKQKLTLKNISDKEDLSLSQICLKALKECGYI